MYLYKVTVKVRMNCATSLPAIIDNSDLVILGLGSYTKVK